MDNLSVCPAQSASEFSTSESEKLKALASGPSVSAPFTTLIRAYGLRRTLVSKYARFLYTLRLWLLRELSIFAVLTQNYEKIPRRSLSKIFIAVPYYLRPARRLNARLLAALKKRVTTSPYQTTRTVNN